MSRAKGRALWLPDVLRDAGLRIEVTPGWEHRGKEPTEWLAQVNHHTASNRNAGAHPSLGILQTGRSDVPGPLSNTSPGRDGVIRIIAAGAANHPGVSYLPLRGGISSGVKYYTLGHEVELDGIGEPFPVEGPQYESVSIMNAAICIYLGLDPATTLFDHKYIARPHGRKIDIRPYDLPTGRVRCARRMTGQHPAPVPTPVIIQEDDMARAYRFPNGEVWLCTGTHRSHVNGTTLKERAVLGLVAEVPATDPHRDTRYPMWVRKTDARGAAILSKLAKAKG